MADCQLRGLAPADLRTAVVTEGGAAPVQPARLRRTASQLLLFQLSSFAGAAMNIRVASEDSTLGPTVSRASSIEIGPLKLDPEGFAVTVGGQDVSLTLAEFLLLQELANHPFQVLDRARLSAVLREQSLSQLAGSARSVDTHISRLRAKLREAGYDCIRTMRFVGYRLTPSPSPLTMERGVKQGSRPAALGTGMERRT